MTQYLSVWGTAQARYEIRPPVSPQVGSQSVWEEAGWLAIHYMEHFTVFLH